MSALVVALLNAAILDPCASLPDHLDEVESSLRRPLLQQTEGSLPTEVRADLIARRARAACELRARLSAVSVRAADRGRLKQVLDRAEFAGARARTPDWLARWLRRLAEWLESFFDWKGAQSFASIIRALVLGAAAAAAALGLFRVALRRLRARAPKPSAKATTSPSLEPPADHLSLARAALSTDAREAIRQGLLALLSCLERRRLARPDRAKTNRELAKELPQRGASAELSETVASLMGWYDRAFYSLSGIAREDALRFIDRVAALKSSDAGGMP